MIESIRKIVEIYREWDVVKNKVNRVIINRIATKAQERSHNITYQINDWRRALKIKKWSKKEVVTQIELSQLDLVVNSNDFDVREFSQIDQLTLERLQTIESTLESRSQTIESTKSSSRNNQFIMSLRSTSLQIHELQSLKRSLVSSIANSFMKLFTSSSKSSQNSSRSFVFKRANEKTSFSSSLSSTLNDEQLMLLRIEIDVENFLSIQQKLRRLKEDQDIYDDNIDSTKSQDTNISKKIVNFVQVDEHHEFMKCDCSRVFTFLRQIISKTKEFDLESTLKLLKRLKAKRSTREIDSCYAHLMKLVNRFELQTRKFNKKMFKKRLDAIYQHRVDLISLKIDQIIYQWFHQEARSRRSSDAMRCYRFEERSINFDFNDAQWRKLMSTLSRDTLKVWQKDDFVIIKKVFTWLMQCAKWTNMLDELWCYNYHFREINERSNMSWLRNYLYSILQQMIRIDLLYYYYYVLLKSNHCHHLIFYSYYCKLAQSRDLVHFRHIDLNVDDLIDEREKNQIQDSIFFIDEFEHDCTKLLLKMHKYLFEWHKRLTNKNLSKTKVLKKNVVARVELNMFDDKNRKNFDIDWKSQFCFVEAIRISMSQISHKVVESQ